MNSLTVYQENFTKLCKSGFSVSEAVISLTHKYLNGQPAKRGKKKLNKRDRDTAFWMSAFWTDVSSDVFETEVFSLALTRYLGQNEVMQNNLLQNIFDRSPSSLYRAIKYSQVFLLPEHLHWREICKLNMDKRFASFLEDCGNIQREQSRFHYNVKVIEGKLEQLSPLDVLVYASLYAFKYLIGPLAWQIQQEGGMNLETMPENKDAIEQILLWKLKNSDNQCFNLTLPKIAESLKEHMTPFLFPDESPSSQKLRGESFLKTFKQLASAHIELNDFNARVVDWFCFSEGYNLPGETPEQSQWARNGKKLEHLHMYWFHRAINDFASSEFSKQSFGLPENDEWNRFAFLKTLRTNLELLEIYGFDDEVTIHSGFKVELFKVLHSIELMSLFYQKDFVLPFCKNYEQTGNWQLALAQLAIDGLVNGMQNRFPITFAKQNEKAESLRAWTRSDKWPRGNKKTAEVILEFWTNDLKVLADHLRTPIHEPLPELHERPILKVGRYLFTLPWMMCFQNNSTAAINNLRRLGRNMRERQAETHRIELRLATAFETCGFQVLSNCEFPEGDMKDAGEIDLICFRDGHLFIFEVKSTYLRKTLQEAWHHRTNTLRKAGLQLKRKKEAVIHAIETNFVFEKGFKVDKLPCDKNIHSWIIDTSIEYDHQYFSGFLKVSFQEILIVLRNERHLLRNPEEFFSPEQKRGSYDEIALLDDLYPHGFSAECFADIIENGQIWDVLH